MSFLKSAVDRNVILRGQRVTLRPVELSDVNDSYLRWMNDPEVNRYMETRFRSNTLEDIRAFVEKMSTDPGALFMAILLGNEGGHIGNIKLGAISGIHRRSEISFFLGDKRFWGKGLASEAIVLLSEYGLNNLHLIKITGGCYSNNTGSIRTFEKSGYTCEGILRRHYLCDGKLVDRLCFARFAPDQVEHMHSGTDDMVS